MEKEMRNGFYVKGSETSWFKDDLLHKEDGPAVIVVKKGEVYYEGWYKEGKLHREGGPARVWKDGRSFWYKDGKLHREDGPAFNHYSKEKRWYFEGRLHRLDGPALIIASGEEWWKDGKLHRTDGPAVDKSFERKWFYDGKLHNKYGPAIIRKGLTEVHEYFLHGEELTYEEWWEEIPDFVKIKILFNKKEFLDSLVWKTLDVSFFK
jgi:hypothetical protein